MKQFLCLLLSLLLGLLVAADPDYKELLSLQPLNPASLLASFNFRTKASLQSYQQQHFKYIPRSLGQILQHAKTKELHLRFSTGKWDAESWGARPWGGTKEGGTGVELWAWVEADSDSELAEDSAPRDLRLIREQVIRQMGDTEQCSVRPVLRLAKFHRLHEDHETSNDLRACQQNIGIFVREPISLTWNTS